jgi:hypothetical protein
MSSSRSSEPACQRSHGSRAARGAGPLVPVLCLALAFAGPARSQGGQGDASGEPQRYMRTVGFDAGEIAAMEGGRAVARVIDEQDDIDADVVGVVHIDAREEAMLASVRRIETLESSAPVLQIGRFGDPPSVDDLAGLTLDPQDLDDLHRCRIGSCDLKVGGSTMELARRIDWNAPDAPAQASRLVKEVIVQHVRRYLVEGKKALAVYDDDDVPHSVAAEFEKILDRSPNLLRYNPDFIHYLLDFPDWPLPDVENFLYWCKQRLRKPVVSVVHACIEKVTRDGQTGYFIALKHIYDSHYFRANVEFLTLVPATGGRSGFYLVHSIRARMDPPRHFRGMLLGKIKGAMKAALIQNLDQTKRQLEAQS